MKKKQMGIMCLALALAGGSLYGSSWAVVPAYAYAAEEVPVVTAEAAATAMDFLALCDTKELITVSVTGNAREEIQAKVNELIEGKKTDYDKAEAIYGWIAASVDYISDQSIQISSEPYAVFQQKQAVCGGYSNLLKEMMNLAGIPAVAVIGNYHANGTGVGAPHQWNAIYVNDGWIMVDSVAAGYFGTEGMENSHRIMQVMNVSIPVGNLFLGYDRGLAVAGCTGTVVEIPDTYNGYPITAISYVLLGDQYKIEELHLNQHISYIDESTLRSSLWIKSITADEKNASYASRQGALFTKDLRTLVVYPQASANTSFTLPKETEGLDTKDDFASRKLESIEVEEGSESFASYDGAIYNKKKETLLLVPKGKKSITIYGDAAVDEMAFANMDATVVTMITKAGSAAAQFGRSRGMTVREYPQISPAGGEYQGAQEITITVPFEHAKIYYTTDGSEPDEKSIEYKAPFMLESDTTLKVVVMDAEQGNTQVVTETYTIKEKIQEETEAPVISLESGEYQGSKEISITGPSAEARIYYTLDGSTPTEESLRYEKPFLIEADTKIKAIAVEEGKKPSQVVTREYKILEEVKPTEKPWIFTDVEQDGNWKHESVNYVYQKGYMADVGNSRQFQPDAFLSRAMFATVLYRMAGNPEVVFTPRFSDVKDETWYSDAVLWAFQEGIVQGLGDGSYGVDDNITREQIAKMLYEYGRVCEYSLDEKKDLGSFTDPEKVSDWAVTYMEWAVGTGMISGKPDNPERTSFSLDPQGDATRAECAAMLMRFAAYYGRP